MFDINSIEEIKELLKDMVKYGFPTISIILSILAYRDSRKVTKNEIEINKIDQKLKKYELEEKEKLKQDENKCTIEAKVVKISQGKYRIKFWNSGNASAYNVDFRCDNEDVIIMREKELYDILEPQRNFDEIIIVSMNTPRKFEITTMWENKIGEKQEKKQFVAING